MDTGAHASAPHPIHPTSLTLAQHVHDARPVLAREQHQALRRLPVAARPPCLLKVPLDALAERVVHHEPHVGGIYAHPERDGRHDDAQLAVAPVVLDLGCRSRVFRVCRVW